jgi:hypothetical protein
VTEAEKKLPESTLLQVKSRIPNPTFIKQTDTIIETLNSAQKYMTFYNLFYKKLPQNTETNSIPAPTSNST